MLVRITYTTAKTNQTRTKDFIKESVKEALALDSWGDPSLPWSPHDVLDKAHRMLASAQQREVVALALDALHDKQALCALLQAWHS